MTTDKFRKDRDVQFIESDPYLLKLCNKAIEENPNKEVNAARFDELDKIKENSIDFIKSKASTAWTYMISKLTYM